MIDRNDEPRDDESRGSFVGKNRVCSVGEFFKGWRRKAGLVTLVIACVVAIGWMRSYTTKEEVLIPAIRRQHAVLSADGMLFWMAWEEKSPRLQWMSVPLLAPGPHDVYTRHFPTSMLSLMDLSIVVDEQHLIIRGSDLSLPAYSRSVIGYWLLAIPLTLLSAWLILAKPRKAKTATGSTP